MPASSGATFYILQESLTNVQKHSHAENVHIDLNFKAREVTLSVKD
jgi:signal transduction histidine kinase